MHLIESHARALAANSAPPLPTPRLGSALGSLFWASALLGGPTATTTAHLPQHGVLRGGVEARRDRAEAHQRGGGANKAQGVQQQVQR
jgi:hypothetical protein